MNSFATANLPQIDAEIKIHCVFHFGNLEELFNAREAVRPQHPKAFFIPSSYQALVPDCQFEPVGTSW
ncbi:3741_t:CDS:2 [Dentiscutata erythropus]|uniref:3741_t:CDS:1 n=1 Tax=Dentiscutata erythropus TaxID=1348616 RepID=A0A9N9I5G2_9GLOM|nr:3741_t:CDS:2 [Dentiscutata erythropus]